MESDKVIDNWEDMNLNESLLRGIFSYGFEKPTPIQCQSIIPIIDRRDIIAQAQSGTGKTGSFTIGSLQRINFEKNTTQLLLLVPTHELVKQVYDVFTCIGSTIENMKIKTLIGGTSIQDDAEYFKNNTPHIVIGTSGRTCDMINRKILKLDHIELFVLDEADVMLSRGFKENIQNIVVSLYKNTQIVLFSATIPEEVLELTDKFMNNPVKIILEPEKLSLECIQQYYIAIQSDKDKFDTLKDLFSVLQVNQSIIYVNTIERVNQLYDAMISDGFPVIYIHSNMDKHERANAMKKFRNGEYRVLISSGITARGIDIQQVSTVINFDITRDVHTYLHAIGRSGRYGRKGLAINFVTKRDIYTMKKIEEHYKINIKELPVNVNELL
tara:strand:+ start:27681 stop:28832 length:1152 start_codon:yes stop_codon:yes gene_type:complete